MPDVPTGYIDVNSVPFSSTYADMAYCRYAALLLCCYQIAATDTG